MTKQEKALQRATESKEYFAHLYGVDSSCVVWCGSERFIIVKDGQEIRIGFNL